MIVSFVDILFLISIFQGLFFGLALVIGKRNASRAKWWLVGLLLLFTVSLGRYWFQDKGFFTLQLAGFLVLVSLNFAYGPLLYNYIKARLQKAGYPPIVHFIPMGIWLVLAFLGWMGGMSPIVEEWLNFSQGGKISFVLFLSFLSVSHLSSYTVACYRILKKTLQEPYQKKRRPEFAWLKRLVFLFTILNVLAALFYLLFLFGLYYSVESVIETYLYLFQAFFIHAIAFHALLYPDLLLGVGKSGMKMVANTKKQELLNLMDKEKPYLNGALKIQDLAKLIQLTTHQLSQLLNDDLQTNFFDFVNSYRVEEAKKHLVDRTSNFTMLAIAYEAGFNSKTAFNRAFKKHTSMTPTEYKKSCSTL